MRYSQSLYSVLSGSAALALLLAAAVPLSAQMTNSGLSQKDPMLTLLRQEPVQIAPEKDGDAGDWRDAYEYFKRLRAYPNDRINWAAYARARAHRDQMRAATPQALRAVKTGSGPRSLALPPPPTQDNEWKFLGPQNWTPPYQWGSGPFDVNGRVNAVAYDPNNASVFYLASPTGGVWKTTNTGTTWTSLTDSLPSLSFSSLAIDPTNSNVVYAGTGDYDGSFAVGFGLLKSTNGGATWTALGTAQFGQQCIHKILIDPANTQNLLVTIGRDPSGALDGGIYRSTNGGATWTQVLGPNTTPQVIGDADNVVYNADRSAVYAVFDFAGVYKSTDNGQTWTGPMNGFVPPGGNIGNEYRLDLGASVLYPGTLYLLSAVQERVYKSTDGGTTWVNTTDNLNGSFGQAFYDFYLVCSKATVNVNGTPKVKDVVYIGLLDIFQTTDGGYTWWPVLQTYTGNDLAHTDQHALVVNPNNPNDMLVGNDGGIYRFVYSPPSNSYQFTGMNAGLGITHFYGAAFHPYDKTHTLGGTQDNGTGRADGNFSNWDTVTGGDGGFSAINQKYPQQQFSTVYFGIMFRTDDDWNACVLDQSCPGGSPTAFIAPLALDDASTGFGGGILYMGASQQLWQYSFPSTPPFTCAAGAWAQASPQLDKQDPNDVVTSVGVSPANNSFVYAGTADGIVYSTVAGRIDDQGNAFGLPPLAVTNIEGSQLFSKRAYVTLSGSGAPHVWRCDDVTAKPPIWVDISGTDGPSPLPDVSTNWLVVMPHDDEQQLYVATDVGVFFTDDGGQTWQNATAPLGLPNIQVNQLIYKPSSGYMQAATFGRGLWHIAVGNNIPFNLYPKLEYWRGAKSKLNTMVEFFHAYQRSPRAEVRFGNLTAGGWFQQYISSYGNYDIYVTIPRFLRKKVPQQLTYDLQIYTGLMYCGDVDGDNKVTARDVLLVERAMGQYTQSTVDLDGDGIVTIRDLNIALRNLGRVGD